jgi:SAM-dependent methyltransferase
VTPSTVYDPSDSNQFGNLEANLRFLRESGLLGLGVRVLEIGSGRGVLLKTLRDRGVNVIGIEPSGTLSTEARRLHGALPIARMSGTSLGFPDHAFDVVISFDVFEHINDSDAHIMEVRRVLRPGGAYALQTPNKWTNSVFETIRWRSFTRWKADHCALHSYTELKRRFDRHGFDVSFGHVPVVNDFYRQKLRRYLGGGSQILLAVAQPDRWPMPLKTNFFVVARHRTASPASTTPPPRSSERDQKR